MPVTRREAALDLATDLLDDLELSRIPHQDIVKKVSRLARLLDDTDALDWLSFELTGFPVPLTYAATTAAERSNRMSRKLSEDGQTQYLLILLSEVAVNQEANLLMIEKATSPSERQTAKTQAQMASGIAGKVIGSLYQYVAEKEIELRFGAAVESAFTTVRNAVDARIARLAPNGAAKLAAAFENASSDNPEHWANAASECRRLLKEIADRLRPAGEPVGGRPMGDGNYINRLVDWISQQNGIGDTHRKVVTADLEDFGKRIDAFDGAGHKGAHDEVSKYEASRFIAGVYLLVGDILDLWKEPETPQEADSA